MLECSKKRIYWFLPLLFIAGAALFFILNPGLIFQNKDDSGKVLGEFSSAPNKQINYQGKLTDLYGFGVADDRWNMEFRLYTFESAVAGDAIWVETRTGDDRASTTAGLFSLLLGSVSSLDDIDFNQSLWLGVNVGGTTTEPVWDGEMSPRKLLGAVPAAFETIRFGGLATSSFLRSDEPDVMSSSSADAILTVRQDGAGNIIQLMDGANVVFSVADGGDVVFGNNGMFFEYATGNLGIGTSSPSARLDVWGNLRVATGSTPALFVDTATGNVGIGTDSPDAGFHFEKIAGHTAETTIMSSYFNTTLVNQANSTTTLIGLHGKIGYNSTYDIGGTGHLVGTLGYIENMNTGNIGDAMGLEGRIDQTAAGTIDNAYGVYSYLGLNSGTVNNWYAFYAANESGVSNITNRFSLFSPDPALKAVHLGNIGINNLSPQTYLHISGSTGTGGNLMRLSGTVDDSENYYLNVSSVIGAGTIDYRFHTVDFIGGTKEMLYLDSSAGYVGIGTTSPLAALDTYGNLILSGASRYLNFNTISGTDGYGIRDNSGTIEFKHSTGDWAAVGSGGSGSGTVNYGAAGALAFYPSAGTAATGTDLSKLYFNNANGYLGIGSNTPSQMLSVGGLMYIDGTGTSTITDNLQIGGNLKLGNNSIILNEDGMVANSSYNISAGSNDITIGGVIFKGTNGLALSNLAANPGSAVLGQMYYNSTSNKIYVYTNTGWQDLSSGSSDYFTTSGTVSSGNYIEIAHNQSTTNLVTTGWVYNGTVWESISSLSSTDSATDYSLDFDALDAPYFSYSNSLVFSGGQVRFATTTVNLNTESDYTQEDLAYSTTLTPNATSGFSVTLTLGSGNWNTNTKIKPGCRVVGSSGEAIIMDSPTAQSTIGASTTVSFASTDAVGAGNWQVYCSKFENGVVKIASSTWGNDSYTKLLVHGDETTGAKSIVDSAVGRALSNVITQAGDASTTAAVSKFGNTLAFDGTGDYFNIPDSADWNFGSGSFTIDFWLKRAAVSGAVEYLGGQLGSAGTAAQNSCWLAVDASGYPTMSCSSGSTSYARNNTTAIIDTDWHHVAFIRNGNYLYVALDGNFSASTDVTGVTLNDVAYLFGIGRAGEYATNYFKGNIDEFRISKGIARWTENFTPPAGPYGAMPIGEYYTITTNDNSQLGAQGWDGLKSTVVTETLNSQKAYYSFSDDDRSSFKVFNGYAIDSYDKLIILGDEAAGSTNLTDSSLNARALNAYGNASTTAASAKFGNAMVFDGTGDYFLAAASNDFSYGTGDFTIDAWVRFTDTSTRRVIIGPNNMPNITSGLVVLMANANSGCIHSANGRVAVLVNTGSNVCITGNSAINDNQWHHVALVRNNAVLKLYVDGVYQSQEATQSGSLGTASYALTVGRWTTLSDWAGGIDEVKISKGIARWTSDFTPPTVSYGTANAWRDIAKNDAGTWKYNSSSTFSGETWTSCSTNDANSCVSEAVGADIANQMSGSTFNNLSVNYYFPVSSINTLDYSVSIRSDSYLQNPTVDNIYANASSSYSVITTTDSSRLDTFNWTDINAAVASSTNNSGNIKYAVSFDGRTSWKYWTGSAWDVIDIADFSEWSAKGMTSAVISGIEDIKWESSGGFAPGNSPAVDFAVGFQAADIDSASPLLDQISVDYSGSVYAIKIMDDDTVRLYNNTSGTSTIRLDAVVNLNTGSLFSDAGAFTYLKDTTDDLTIGSDATSSAIFWLDTHNKKLRLAYDSNNFADLSINSSGDFAVSTTDTASAFVIKKDGKLGIGTTTPWGALHIAQTGMHGLYINKAPGALYKGLYIMDDSGDSEGVQYAANIEMFNITGALSDYRAGLRIHVDASNSTASTNKLTGMVLGVHALNGQGMYILADGATSTAINTYAAGQFGNFMIVGDDTNTSNTIGEYIVHRSVNTALSINHIGATTTGDLISLNSESDGTGDFQGNFLSVSENGSPKLVIDKTGMLYSFVGANFIDNSVIWLGSSWDAALYYDGADVILNTQIAGTGDFLISGGNVGIGSSSPSTKLTVAGTSTLENIIPALNLTYNLGDSTHRWNEAWISTLNLGTSTWSMTQSANGRLSIFDAASGGGNERMTINANGNIGMGATVAGSRLTLPYGQTVGWTYSSGNSGVYQTIGKSADGSGPMEFKTSYTSTETEKVYSFYGGAGAANELVTILNGGKVGIGTVGPTAYLTVARTKAALFTAVGTNGGSYYLSTDPVLSVTTDGTNDTNSTSYSSNKLFVVGRGGGINGPTDNLLYITLGGTSWIKTSSWTYNSDVRAKENITYLDNGGGLDKILALNPARFDYIFGDKDQLGFIAQDVQPVIPEAVVVTDPETGMLGLKTNFIIPYLVGAFKELNSVINIAYAPTSTPTMAIDSNGFVRFTNPPDPLYQGGETASTSTAVAVFDFEALASTTLTAFVVNQEGDGDIADFQKDKVSVMNINNDGIVKIVGDLLVDGRVMACSGGVCPESLENSVESTFGDMGVEGKVVAGEFEGYCDDGYIWIPGSAKYGTTPGFCVMARKARYDADSGGLMQTNADMIDLDNPVWTELAQAEAQLVCQSLGSRYHLISENEWLTIAENIIRVADNDIDPETPGLQLATSTIQLGTTSIAFKLANNTFIHELVGEMGEWTDGLSNKDDCPLPLSEDWAEYNEITSYKAIGQIRPPYYYDSTNGIGKIKTGMGAFSLFGFVRGNGGIFSLDMSNPPTYLSDMIGFRCAK